MILLLFKLQKKTKKKLCLHIRKRSFIILLQVIVIELRVMAVRNLTLPTFPTFNTSEEPSSLFPRWERYKKRFNLLCAAIGVDNDPQKLSMLLTYIGDEAQARIQG